MDPHRMPRCKRTGKIIYDTACDATNEAARLIARGSPMVVYKCPHSNHYHVGTQHKMRAPREFR